MDAIVSQSRSNPFKIPPKISEFHTTDIQCGPASNMQSFITRFLGVNSLPNLTLPRQIQEAGSNVTNTTGHKMSCTLNKSHFRFSCSNLGWLGFAGSTASTLPTFARDLSQTGFGDVIAFSNGTAAANFTTGSFCYDEQVTSNGSIAPLVGHCTLETIPSAYSISFGYSNPKIDEFYQGVAVWANAENSFNDGDFRSLDISIDHLNLAANPQTISGHAVLRDTVATVFNVSTFRTNMNNRGL